MLSISAFGKERQDFSVRGQPSLQSEFQGSQGYTEEPFPKKKEKKKKEKEKKNRKNKNKNKTKQNPKADRTSEFEGSLVYTD
ncbi:RIKEN cDNA B230340J04 [Mus musculus]|jgi:hypothetical protein|nr:RIKEN cDNA B230340J04 [Mus musculus]